MRIVSEERLGRVLGALPGTPRVVAGGNYATPWCAMGALDAGLARYRLFAMNVQPGVPDRDGVTLEPPFVGPGMRGSERLRYFPCRLSLVPVLLSGGTVSLGSEVSVLPAAIEAEAPLPSPPPRPVTDTSALNLDLGRWAWWPSRLSRKPDPATEELSKERAAATLTG